MGDRGLDKLLGVPRDVGHPVAAGARVLDFGCGNGSRVRALLERGYDAYGCDLRFKDGPHRETLEQQRRLRLIEPSPYALPFDTASVDFLFSEQVFEHVRNYDETLAEIRRVLAPGGIGLHVFPSRWRPIEGHVHVPFASVFRPHAWLYVWACLGVRKAGQRGFGPGEVARQNKAYLDGHTNYLPRAAIAAHVSRHFAEHRFCERAALRYSRLAPLWPLLRWLPGLGFVLGTFQTRVLLVAVARTTAAADAADGVRPCNITSAM
jgi:SAM-dependent methyltransferase